jgi:arylamine N-acetyltransferase
MPCGSKNIQEQSVGICYEENLFFRKVDHKKGFPIRASKLSIH